MIHLDLDRETEEESSPGIRYTASEKVIKRANGLADLSSCSH